MKQREIYLSKIDRHIEGVIKADSNEFIGEEIEEYVVTNELQKHLGYFFQEYSKKNFSESVWISGFFGSGKSHLLKILSYILQNKPIEDTTCTALFKKKVSEDFELVANIDKSAKIPCETLLFNIDQKAATITTKSQTDAVLSVFLRVFNEHQGYFGGDHYTAEIERNLDEQGLFLKFKEETQNLIGDSWEKIRDGINFRTDDFAKVYSKIKNIPFDEALKVLDKQADFTLSIEDFVNRVVKYINKKPAGFRLIFCVDEIGQYIADNTKLMLNLQTLAETLQTKSNGKAFLIVTSQNDIGSFIKDLKNSQSNDFSRIQDRFRIKMALQSKDVNEVIQKRLLAKTDASKIELNKIYEAEKNNLKTLFRFTSESRQYKEYSDDLSFVQNYPFIPYQFDLFQSTLRGLSEHNVFMGKHQSVGERSMLSVFQAVARTLADSEIGVFVEYSSIFDGIRSTLKSEIQASIIQAEKNIDDPLAISLLKVLFLVKYVKEFKANLQNITAIMQNSYNNEIGAFRTGIQNALNKLENQTYIQRVGDLYEFLTNDEKDVENEIKGTEIDDREITTFLADLLFNEILKDAKVKLESNNQPYEFGKKLDDNMISKEKDFYVHFITPLNPNEITKANIHMKSITNSDLIVFMPDNDRLVEELRMHRKTAKYISIKSSNSLKPEIKKILGEKGELNQERRKNLLITITENIKNAPMYLNGTEITDITVKEPISKIKSAVEKLIYSTYQSLSMLVQEFKEEDIKKILMNNDDVLINVPVSNIEIEVSNYLTRIKNSNDRATVKSIIDYCSGRPYGWYALATVCIIASLYKKNKINIKKDSNLLDAKQLFNFINNRNEQNGLIVELEEDIGSSEVKRLKDFHYNFFNENNSGNDPKEISRLFKEKLKLELVELQRILAQKSQFSFVSYLDDTAKVFKDLINKDHPYFYKSIGSFEDILLDAKEKLIDPIKQFINSQQKDHYESIRKFYESNSGNIKFLAEEHQKLIAAFFENLKPFNGNFVQQAKANYENISNAMQALITDEVYKTTNAIKTLIDNAIKLPDYSKLGAEMQKQVLEPIYKMIAGINNEKFIANNRDMLNGFQQNIFPKLIQEISELANPYIKPPVAPEGGSTTRVKELVPTHFEVLSIKSIDFKLKKTVIESEADVNDYVESLKSTLISLIKDNKKITL